MSAGFSVAAHYYDGAEHDLYYVAPNHADAVARVVAFFR